MSKKSDALNERLAALGLRVVTGKVDAPAAPAPAPVPTTRPRSAQDDMVGTGFERRRPASAEITARAGVPAATDYPRGDNGKPATLTVAAVNGSTDDIAVKATTFVQWLEQQYHDNIAPFAFLSDLALNVDDFPADDVVQMACKMLRAKGWQIHVHYFNSAGCKAGTVTMMHPDMVGF